MAENIAGAKLSDNAALVLKRFLRTTENQSQAATGF